MNKFHNIKSLVNDSTTASVTVYDLSLSSLLTSAQEGSIRSFQYYKIVGVAFRAVPQVNTVSQAGTASSTSRTLYTLFESNPDAEYPSLQSVYENSRTRTHRSTAGFNRYARLRPTVDVTMGVTDISMRNKSHWISTEDPGAVYGRFIVALSNITPSTTVASVPYDIYVTTYIALKNINTPIYVAARNMKMEL